VGVEVQVCGGVRFDMGAVEAGEAFGEPSETFFERVDQAGA
jgi:hypothetical protein